jgi:hypothetical protein
MQGRKQEFKLEGLKISKNTSPSASLFLPSLSFMRRVGIWLLPRKILNFYIAVREY